MNATNRTTRSTYNAARKAFRFAQFTCECSDMLNDGEPMTDREIEGSIQYNVLHAKGMPRRPVGYGRKIIDPLIVNSARRADRLETSRRFATRAALIATGAKYSTSRAQVSA